MQEFTKQIIRHKYEYEIKYFPKVNHSCKEKKDRVFKAYDMEHLTPSQLESLARTKRTIKDYARNNDFDYFVTFTLDPKQYKSFDIDVVYHVTEMFIQRLKRDSDDAIKYLLVPEYHADKQKIHLHGYIKGNLKLYKTALTYKGKRVYNSYQWNAGFSQVVKIGKSINDTLRCSNYITKYVTKDLIMAFNKKRYWCSKNLDSGHLIKEKTVYAENITDLYANELPGIIKEYDIKSSNDLNMYSNDYYFTCSVVDSIIEN